MLILTNARVYTPLEVVEPATLFIDQGRIADLRAKRHPRGEDLKGALVVPGFIDLHIHGYGGHDTNSGEPEELLALAELLPRYGVTAFLPTTVTASHEELLRASRAVAQAIRIQGDRPRGARILGLHLEGPYINPEKAGAQNSSHIRPPDWDEFLQYWDAAGGKIRAVTVAPELPGALEFIGKAVGLGVTVSIGHTAASYEKARAAIRAGARRATHLFNAMPPVHHRAPGVAVACLLAPEVAVELIADLVHVAGPMLELAWRVAGTERVMLVTDAIPAGGLPDGHYALGGLEVDVREGVARLGNGALAGSTLSLDQAVRNAVSIGIPLRDAFCSATSVPAQACGLAQLGTLQPGNPADFIVLDPELNLLRTYVGGERLF